jgi:rhodanese-related sulfurtransferase
MEQILKNFTLEFFGQGKHKITPEKLFETENAVFLDTRSKEEVGSLSIKLEYHSNIQCLQIPLDEITDRINEIPQEKLIGIFCPANVRSSMAYAYLLSKGFSNVRIIEGGYAALTEALLPGKVRKAVLNRK